jgi:MFS family permease
MRVRLRQTSWWVWLGWLIATLAGLYQFLLQISPGVMIPELSQSFHLDELGVSLLSSSFFYTYILCQIPAGILIDYFKARRVLTIFLTLMAIVCVTFSQAQSLWVAEISRILMGFFAAPFAVSAFYLAAHTLPERFFAIIVGFTETLAMAGSAIGQILMARGVMTIGWRHTLLVMALIAVFLAVCAFFFIRDEKDRHVVATPRGFYFADIIAMFKMSQAWINGLFCGLTFGLIAAFGSFWAIPYLMAAYQVPLHKAAEISSMIFLGAGLGAPLIGWLTHYFSARLVMMACTFAAVLVSLILLYIPVKLGMVFLLMILLGFFSAVYLLPFAVMRDITPSHMRGTVMGYVNMMCILIGSPILQPLIGWILSTHTTSSLSAYHQALSVIPFSLVVAFILAYFVQERSA